MTPVVPSATGRAARTRRRGHALLDTCARGLPADRSDRRAGREIRSCPAAWAPTLGLRARRPRRSTRVARTLRAYHDATLDFAAAAQAPRGSGPRTSRVEVICHNDFAPYNMIFEDGRLDRDHRLGPRLARAARVGHGLRRLPLRAAHRPRQPRRRGNPGVAEQAAPPGALLRRLRRAGRSAPRAVAETAVAILRDLVAFIRREAAAGDARPDRRARSAATPRSTSATSPTSRRGSAFSVSELDEPVERLGVGERVAARRLLRVGARSGSA